MLIKSIRDYLSTKYPDAYVFNLPSFDNSIIGVTEDGKIVYDYALMVAEFAQDSNIELVDAIAFIEYNTMRALPYIKEAVRPVIIFNSVDINQLKGIQDDTDKTKYF